MVVQIIAKRGIHPKPRSVVDLLAILVFAYTFCGL